MILANKTAVKWSHFFLVDDDENDEKIKNGSFQCKVISLPCRNGRRRRQQQRKGGVAVAAASTFVAKK